MRSRAGLGLSAVVLVGLGLAAFFRRPLPRAVPQLIQLEVGGYLSAPGGKPWPTKGAERTIVIATSGTCASCSSSRDIADSLYLQARAFKMPVVYLVSTSAEQDPEAKRLKSEGRTVWRGSLFGMGVGRTPTFLALDASGRIVALHVGTVEPKLQDRFFAELLSGSTRHWYDRISGTEAAEYAKQNQKYQLVALSKPKSPVFQQARYDVIPEDELAMRAPYELSPEVTTFVDCDTAPSMLDCQSALITLGEALEFGRLFAIGLPTRQEQMLQMKQ